MIFYPIKQLGMEQREMFFFHSRWRSDVGRYYHSRPSRWSVQNRDNGGRSGFSSDLIVKSETLLEALLSTTSRALHERRVQFCPTGPLHNTVVEQRTLNYPVSPNHFFRENNLLQTPYFDSSGRGYLQYMQFRQSSRLTTI